MSSVLIVDDEKSLRYGLSEAVVGVAPPIAGLPQPAARRTVKRPRSRGVIG
jgi:hypothetical protein